MGVFQKGLSEHLTDITVAAFTDTEKGGVVVAELTEKYSAAIEGALNLVRMDMEKAGKHLIDAANHLASEAYEDAKVAAALAAKTLMDTYESIAPHNPPQATTAQAGASNDGASAEAGALGESDANASASTLGEPSPSDQKEESSSAPAATAGSISSEGNNTAGESEESAPAGAAGNLEKAALQDESAKGAENAQSYDAGESAAASPAADSSTEKQAASDEGAA